MKRHEIRWMNLALVAWLAAACAPVASVVPTPSASVPAPTVSASPSQTPRPTRALVLVPSVTPAAEEVPAKVIAQLKDDLQSRLGGLPEDLQVARSEAVVWNDGSLGCPQPGVMYTQSLVAGYWVVFESGQARYDYRVPQSGGQPLLCDLDLPVQP
jgi:hypothetical protein